MPLTRYQLRNEYSLADPELYRAADKDDPEALLEGVAMAGLVGLLRQLGDLAEFAAEIFHSLHEEVMTTAARGHGLTLRVQQLEAEVPFVEKVFLSQTNHTLFLHNSGVDWHTNLRLDQNLITQGDLPRFVMDSYEECRGPPRLFLLDKFDIAGAGACLKRYTDPSFFKAEFTASEAAKEALKRDKKSLKIKKKGSRWRTGDNPEVTASHSKLHQLLLEERCQSQNNVHTHRVKLKRRHSNNSLINSDSGKSYMERFLNSHSPDSKFICGSSSTPTRLKMGSTTIVGLIPESEIGGKSTAEELITRGRHIMTSHGSEEKVLKPLPGELGLDVIEERNSDKLLGSVPEIELESTPSTFDKVDEKKELLDVKNNTEASAEGYHSDDANSEIDNYADALATMDSETDTESKSKNEQRFKIESKCVDSETNEEQKEVQAQFSDSQSIRNSVVSEDGIDSLGKGSSVVSEDGIDSLEKGRFSSSYSDAFSDSADNIQSHGDLDAKSPPFTISKIVDISSKKTSAIRNASVTRSPKHAGSNGSCNEVSEIPCFSSSFGEAYVGSDVTNVGSVLSSSSPKESKREVQLSHLNSLLITSDPMDSVTEQLSPKSENTEIAGHDLACMASVSDAPSQLRHDFHSGGSQKSQTVGMLDSGNLDVSMDETTTMLSPPHEVKDGDIEETHPTGVSNDSLYTYQMNGKLDSPDSVLFNAETELYGLAEQDLEATSCTRWAPECRPDSPTGGAIVDLEGELREINDKQIADEAVSLELDTEETGSGDSEVGVSGDTNNVDFTMSEYDMKDGHASNGAHLRSSSVEKHSDMYHELPFRSKSVSAAEVPLLVSDSETLNVEIKDVPIGFSNGDVNQDKLETSEASAADIFTRSNAKKEVEKQGKGVASHYDIKLMVECIQTHMNGSDENKQVKQGSQDCNVKETWSPSSEGALLDGESSKSRNEMNSDGWTFSSVDRVNEAEEFGLLSPTSSSYKVSEASGLVLQPICEDSGLPTASNEDVHPLPPLPPMQWRIGKVRNDSPTSGACIAQQEFPSLDGFEMLGGDVMQQPSVSSVPLVVPDIDCHPILEPQNGSGEESPFTVASRVSREGELKWQSNSCVEYGKPIESLKSRLARPRDPLIEAVASHDKSNLRKVTSRILPQVDERNSLLEQIRNKSFNLKPAVATRPSIRGPKTNLKVVAILEKANAIRQALAGSDEDSWSDS